MLGKEGTEVIADLDLDPDSLSQREDAAKFQRSEALNPVLYQSRARGDETPGEAASRGWIWRCGVGRLNWVALISVE